MKKVGAKELSCKPSEISIKEGIVCVNAKPADMTWEDLVLKTYFSRVQLMAHGFYSPPKLHYDPIKGHGRPFHYYTYGTCLIETTVDCLRGTYKLDASRIVHDLGRTIIPTVDRGQIEGGLAQGPLGSKAVGEPPFMYGIAAFFAIRKAIQAFSKNEEAGKEVRCPVTAEQVLLDLYPNFAKSTEVSNQLQVGQSL